MLDTTVHPRSCGDRNSTTSEHMLPIGSSPLVRGSGATSRSNSPRKRFIPARAGIGDCTSKKVRIRSVHPRRCGDRSWPAKLNNARFGSPPQVRGSALDGLQRSRLYRFTPAGAGIGGREYRRHPNTSVHPRRCGDRISLLLHCLVSSGSPPQVRGSVHRPKGRRPGTRFTPAGAGIGLAGKRGVIRAPVHPRRCGDRPTATA